MKDILKQLSLVSERRNAEETGMESKAKDRYADPGKAERVQQLYREGKTMREIAAMESCSVSHVFKLVHEQDLAI